MEIELMCDVEGLLAIQLKRPATDGDLPKIVIEDDPVPALLEETEFPRHVDTHEADIREVRVMSEEVDVVYA